MRAKARKRPGEFGHAEIGLSRYFALYLAEAGWLLLGFYLYSLSLWPSDCQPHGLVKAYLCSVHLPDNRGWAESALACWMWSTPLLLALKALNLLRRWGLFAQH